MVGFIFILCLKRDAGNPISNMYSKTAAANISASNGPTRLTLLSYLPDSHFKLPQQGEPCKSIGCVKIAAAGFFYVFNRPGVAEAVLQTPLSLIRELKVIK